MRSRARRGGSASSARASSSTSSRASPPGGGDPGLRSAGMDGRPRSRRAATRAPAARLSLRRRPLPVRAARRSPSSRRSTTTASRSPRRTTSRAATSSRRSRGSRPRAASSGGRARRRRTPSWRPASRAPHAEQRRAASRARRSASAARRATGQPQVPARPRRVRACAPGYELGERILAEAEPLWPTDAAVPPNLVTMPATLDTVRAEWKEGHRRLEEKRSDPADTGACSRRSTSCSSELRRRVGQTFTLAELAEAYGDGGAVEPERGRGRARRAGLAAEDSHSSATRRSTSTRAAHTTTGRDAPARPGAAPRARRLRARRRPRPGARTRGRARAAAQTLVRTLDAAAARAGAGDGRPSPSSHAESAPDVLGTEIWLDSRGNGIIAHRRAGREPDWLTLGQAAKYLGVAQSTIRKWSDQGRVPAFYTPGGHRRYRRGDLDTFLERSGPAREAAAGRPCSSSTTTRACASRARRVSSSRGTPSARPASADEDCPRSSRAAGPDPARRDDAPDGRVGDAPPRPGAARRWRSPSSCSAVRHESAAARPVSAARSGFVGKPFDPQHLIDADEEILARRSDRLDRHLERWIVQHRAAWLDPVFVRLPGSAASGSSGSCSPLVARVVWRRPALFALVLAADGVADLRHRAVQGRRRARPAAAATRTDAARALPDTARSRRATPRRASLRDASSRFAPRLRRTFLVLAAVIAFSRVYVGVHYPLDVLAGRCSACSSLQLFGRFQKPCNDHGERRQQADPDPHPAARREELLRDRDHPDQDEPVARAPSPITTRLSGTVAGSSIPAWRSPTRASTASPMKKTSLPRTPVCQPITRSSGRRRSRYQPMRAESVSTSPDPARQPFAEEPIPASRAGRDARPKQAATGGNGWL